MLQLQRGPVWLTSIAFDFSFSYFDIIPQDPPFLEFIDSTNTGIISSLVSFSDDAIT